MQAVYFNVEYAQSSSRSVTSQDINRSFSPCSDSAEESTSAFSLRSILVSCNLYSSHPLILYLLSTCLTRGIYPLLDTIGKPPANV